VSVFTAVTAEALERWLTACGAGPLRTFSGVEGGVENSNFRVQCGAGTFVLTLFEWMPREHAERTLACTHALAESGLPVADPWPQAHGWTAPLEGKPAALSRWLDGTHPVTPTIAQCVAIGDFLGHLHARGPAPLSDSRGVTWRTETALKVAPMLSPDEQALLERSLADAAALSTLPGGFIHADLFRDNALFEGDTLTGVIDFHYACGGPFAYDLAVAVLDWCPEDDSRREALFAAYERHRQLTPEERGQWPRLQRMAALRFWLSRAHDAAFPRPGRDVLIKDPAEMRDWLARWWG
jgi:homoserine kinase type II